MPALYLVIVAALTFFGVIHSATMDGVMYLPWALPAGARRIPYQFALAYLVLAGVVMLLGFSSASQEPAHAEPQVDR